MAHLVSAETTQFQGSRSDPHTLDGDAHTLEGLSEGAFLCGVLLISTCFSLASGELCQLATHHGL